MDEKVDYQRTATRFICNGRVNKGVFGVREDTREFSYETN